MFDCVLSFALTLTSLLCIVSATPSPTPQHRSLRAVRSQSTPTTPPPSICLCDDDIFQISHTSIRQNIPVYGSDVWCFDYTISKNPSPARCGDQDLDHIILSSDFMQSECFDITCEHYENIVVDYGCIGSKSCATSIGMDQNTGAKGMKYTFSSSLTDTAEIYMCVKGINTVETGSVYFWGLGTMAFKCPFDAPAFCGLPTQNPTFTTTFDPTPIPTPNPTPNPTHLPTPSPTPSPTQIPTENPTPNPTPPPITTHSPTLSPTITPTDYPTHAPTNNPTTDYPTPYPTPLPTTSPTHVPSTNPTPLPSASPTHVPSTNPTLATDAPTNMPTPNPTPNPTTKTTNPTTFLPTQSPNMESCENGGKLDIVFLIDTSLSMSDSECQEQNEFITELYSSVKGANNMVRAAFIRFDANYHYIDLALNAEPYNMPYTKPKQTHMHLLYNFIRSRPCTTSIAMDGYNNLNSALQTAFGQFENIPFYKSDELHRDKKVVIISNNYLNDEQQQQICAANENKVRSSNIEIVMVNLRNTAPNNYIMCLVQWDTQRIYHVPIVNFVPELQDLVPVIREEICSDPTPVPTVNPTSFPTELPTFFPTDMPTMSPTNFPTENPTMNPTDFPTQIPTINPTDTPTKIPTSNPTPEPTPNPTDFPTKMPTTDSNEFTMNPTANPTQFPTPNPTPNPSKFPTPNPTQNPTQFPTPNPTTNPTDFPTDFSTENPTIVTTTYPSPYPTLNPSLNPTKIPTIDTYATANPTKHPFQPTAKPTKENRYNWYKPTHSPTHRYIATALPTHPPTTTETTPSTQSPTIFFPTPDTTLNPTKNPNPSPTIQMPTPDYRTLCSVCMSDIEIINDFRAFYGYNRTNNIGWFAKPKPPLHMSFSHSMSYALNITDNYNGFTEEKQTGQILFETFKGDLHKYRINWTSPFYIILLCVIAMNGIFWLFKVTKTESAILNGNNGLIEIDISEEESDNGYLRSNDVIDNLIDDELFEFYN